MIFNNIISPPLQRRSTPDRAAYAELVEASDRQGGGGVLLRQPQSKLSQIRASLGGALAWYY